MSKHETANQFKDGLMMDVHPLQTPNTVLTDCLNGTFITYNGNEHVLQNDMGNFKLEKCKLKENYIPIGTASYGDILYIASYNPIDKKFEIGSYPSPLQWEDSKIDGKIPFQSILQAAVAQKVKDEQYPLLSFTELGQYAHSSIFDKDEFKLLPGDKYKLTENLTGPKIEGFEYFILDENNVRQDINGEIEKNQNDPVPVSWQIPGYLGVTSSVLTPFSHKMALMSVTTGPSTVQYNIRSVVSIYDDRLLKPEILDILFKNLVFETEVFIDGQATEDLNPKRKFGHSENIVTQNVTFCQNADIYQWLYDKKQIVYEYTLTVNYESETNKQFRLHEQIQRESESGQIEDVEIYFERPTEIKCIPMLDYLVDDVVEKEWLSGVSQLTLQYDNLKTSITYTANGQDRDMVAVDTFNWTFIPKNPNENINSKDSIQINYDLFTSSEESTLAVFYKPLSTLLSGSFVLPTTPTDEPIIGANDYFITQTATSVSILDFPHDNFVVVFFQFIGSEGVTIDSTRPFTARFLYTGTEISTSEGRGDRTLSLQKNIDAMLSNLKATDVKLQINASNSTYTCSKASLLNSTLSESDFFGSDGKSATIYQKITGNADNVSITQNGNALSEFDGSKFEPEGFLSETKITRLYSTDNDNFSTSGYKDNVEITVNHPVTHEYKEEFYNFSEVSGFTKLNSNLTPVNLYWLTQNDKARFSWSDDWDAGHCTFNCDKDAGNFHGCMIAAFEDQQSGTATTQFKILNLYALRKKGNYSKIFSDAAKTGYLTSGEKGDKVGKTFLLAAYDNGLGSCVVQFDSSGNDDAESLKWQVSKLGYFTFNKSVSGNWSKQKTSTYSASISSAGDLNKLYTLFEKIKYNTSIGTSVYKWICDGSKVNDLKCYDYCEFDSRSTIQNIVFGETDSYQLKSTVEITSNNVSSKISAWNTAWNTMYTTVRDKQSIDFGEYTKILNMNPHKKKLNMYVHSEESTDKLKTFASYVTPDRSSSSRKLAAVSSGYGSKYAPNFYFGSTDSGNTRTHVGYLKGFTEWLPG